MEHYFVIMYITFLALGYMMRLTQTTRVLGRSANDAGTPIEYQNAIAPPRLMAVTIFVFALCLTGVIYGFWKFGWLASVGIIMGLFFAVLINRAFLPKIDSEYFRGLIIHLMIRRYANYLKSGDTRHAPTMNMLLEKFGIPKGDFPEQPTKSGDA